MDFSKPLALFKVMESARVVAIVPHDGIIPVSLGVTWLIQGPMESCIYYVPRYLAARAAGMEPQAAHAEALRGAVINQGMAVILGNKDAPGS